MPIGQNDRVIHVSPANDGDDIIISTISLVMVVGNSLCLIEKKIKEYLKTQCIVFSIIIAIFMASALTFK